MHAPANPFTAQKSSSRTVERVAFGVFRAATYFILLCATCIFGTIIFKGGGTVFQTKAPFINVPFLAEPLSEVPGSLWARQRPSSQREAERPLGFQATKSGRLMYTLTLTRGFAPETA